MANPSVKPVQAKSAARCVAILCHEGCLGMEVMALADLLMIANRVAARLAPEAPEPFRVELCSVKGGVVAMAGGWTIATRRPPRSPAWMIVPGFDFTGRRPRGIEESHAGELALLRRLRQRGVALAAACVGAFLLAEAGVLDGRRATTAWICRDQFRRQYPSVSLQDKESLVADPDASGPPVVTTGSVSAAQDLALYLIARDAGEAVAQATARLALIDARARSQAPYVDVDWVLPASAARASFSAEIVVWMTQRLAAPFSLAALAAAFHVSPRTLLRRFKRETGTSPLARLQQLRIEAAKKQLAGRRPPSVDAVASAVGYTDVASFIRLFKRLSGETPAAYRRRYAPPATP